MQAGRICEIFHRAFFFARRTIFGAIPSRIFLRLRGNFPRDSVGDFRASASGISFRLRGGFFFVCEEDFRASAWGISFRLRGNFGSGSRGCGGKFYGIFTFILLCCFLFGIIGFGDLRGAVFAGKKGVFFFLARSGSAVKFLSVCFFNVGRVFDFFWQGVFFGKRR